MNALASDEVGKYLNRHFVSAFQKVATFQVNGRRKQGGNVAAYFCTPQGRVLHAVAGPVDADTFLREARWANETFQLAQLEKVAPDQLPAFFRKAHHERFLRHRFVNLAQDRLPAPDTLGPDQLALLLRQNGHLGLNNSDKIHLLLTVAPLPRIEHVYRAVFEQILNERISTDPVAVVGRGER